jgi:hypothetical protein
VQLSAVEVRVLGSLLEKQRTTPDAYPLSLNALRLACNQATNRDPVVDYDEAEIREALTRLGRARYTRLTSTQGSRAAKFRHLLDETLALTPPQQAILAVLMLRGPQTPGELRQRTERLHAFPDFEALGAALATLIERGLVERLGRRPGQKEERFAHRLGGSAGDGSRPAGEGSTGDGSAAADTASADEEGASADEASARHPDLGHTIAGHGGPARPAADWTSAASPASPPAASTPGQPGANVDSARLDRLERRVSELADELAALRAELGVDAPGSLAD